MSDAASVLIVGGRGVIGSAVADRLGSSDAWDVTTASRSAAGDSRHGSQHVQVDLLDGAGSRPALAALGHVTHVVYAGFADRSTMAEATAPNVEMLRSVLTGLHQVGAALQRVVLIGGGKSYGAHLGPYRTPAKESDPRLLGPIFYNDQEDLLKDEGADRGFAWTVLRPDVVIGRSTGSPMNLLNSIGMFAALSKDAGVPLRFPGSAAAWTALHQFTDSGLLASAVEWALGSPAAAGETFNVVNGDLFRWQHLWPEIAQAFDMPAGSPQPMSLVDQMADKGHAWDSLVARHRLRPVPYELVTSWAFADGVWNSGFDMVQSTIKIRHAGFHDSVDSHRSLVQHLLRLREERRLP